LVTTVDVQAALKDDLIEVIIDEAVSILAGDIESQNQRGREQQDAESNN
jgi:hypothetical protein